MNWNAAKLTSEYVKRHSAYRALLPFDAPRSLQSYAELVYPDFETPPHLKQIIAKLEAVDKGKIQAFANHSSTPSWQIMAR